MHKLAVFGPPLVAEPLSEYLAVIGYDVSQHPTHELNGFAQRPPGRGHAPLSAELIILDLPVSHRERQTALRALRELRSFHGIPVVLLFDTLGDCIRDRDPEISGSAEAILPKPLHLGSLAAVCSRVFGTANSPEASCLRV